jgi:hypothetical protein
VQLATQIVSDSRASTPFEQATAIQNYLREAITYEENSPAPPDDQDWVDYVLFDYPNGRCEQYATAMVVMVRSLGIPARLVTGYNVRGETNSAGDWIYRDNQKHSWVEVFFPGYGWVPFEPTANIDSFDYDESSGQVDTQVATATPEPDVESSPVDEAEPTPTQEATPEPPSLVVPNDTDDGSFSTLILVLGGIGLTLLVGVFSYILISWRHGLGGLSPAASLFVRLQRLGGWFGLAPTDSVTPGEFGRALSNVVPGSEDHVRAITDAYYIERYNPGGANPQAIEQAEQGWKHMRRHLLRWRSRKLREHT